MIVYSLPSDELDLVLIVNKHEASFNCKFSLFQIAVGGCAHSMLD